MTCHFCGHTMQSLSEWFWCARCGSIKRTEHAGEVWSAPLTVRELMPTAKLLRESQVGWFTKKNYGDLQRSKHLEKEIDRMLADYERPEGDTQRELFSMA